MTSPTSSDLAVVHNSLISGIKSLIESNDWAKHLEFQAKFTKYSFRNTLFLMTQCVERGLQPSRFAGFHTWKGLGRSVKKGEKSFRVLAPLVAKKTKKGEEDEIFIRGWRMVPVFDLSQTEGEELASIVTRLEGSSDEILSLFAKVSSFVEARGWSVHRENTGEANGFCVHSEKRIVVSPSLSDLQSLKTLLHEVGHSVLHGDGDLVSEIREVEAESVAFVVLSALGFDSSGYSFGYVATWSGGDTEIVRLTGERVQKTAQLILDAVQAEQKAVDVAAELDPKICKLPV